MQTVERTTRKAAARMRWLLALVPGVLLPLSPLPAMEVESLYTAEVRLDPEEPDAREDAYQAALQQILVRITGSERAVLAPELTELFPNPARYVLQFRPGEDNTLRVSMDGDAIEKIVRQAGFPVWGSDRPATMLWLAVDWGQGDRELIGAEPAEDELNTPDARDLRSAERKRQLLERIRDTARERGVPFLLPALDSGAFDDVSFTDVWGGFHDRVLAASRRGGADAMLVGRLRPGDAERNRWSFYFGDQQRQWNGAPEEAMHNLADTLAGQLAVSGHSRLDALILTVSGVQSVRDYGEVQRTIANLQPIERFAIESVEGDRIRYRIEISGGAGRLGSALEFSGNLKRSEAPAAAGPAGTDRDAASLHYVYDPGQ